MTNEQGPRTYSVAQFARALGVSKNFAYEQAKTGAIAGVPVLRVGSRLLIPREMADRVLAGEGVGASTPQ